MKFSPRKTLKFLYEKDIISKDSEGKYSVVKYNDTKRGRFVEFDLTKALAATESDKSNDKSNDFESMGFVEVDEDDDLPF